MPEGKISSKTGNAPVKKQGHTHDGKHGSDPNMQVRGGTSTTDLHVPSKRS